MNYDKWSRAQHTLYNTSNHEDIKQSLYSRHITHRLQIDSKLYENSQWPVIGKRCKHSNCFKKRRKKQKRNARCSQRAICTSQAENRSLLIVNRFSFYYFIQPSWYRTIIGIWDHIYAVWHYSMKNYLVITLRCGFIIIIIKLYLKNVLLAFFISLSLGKFYLR